MRKVTPVILFSLLALGLLSGCNTTATTKEKPASADREEYVTVEPEIGSRVKKRVKKSELAQHQNGRSGQRKKFDGDDLTRYAPPMTGPVEETITRGP